MQLSVIRTRDELVHSISHVMILGLVAGQLVACARSSKDLSRSDALAKLQAAPPNQLTTRVDAQIYVPCAQRMQRDGDPNHEGLSNTWDRLAATGIVEERDSVLSRTRPSFPIINCILRLTDRGKGVVGTSWTKRDEGLDHFTYVISVGTRVPTEVTGVAQGAASEDAGVEARVDFRWTRQPTPSTPYFSSSDVHTTPAGPGVALFERFDDGWRLMSVAYGS